MNKFAKKILALSICSVLVQTSALAATYEVVEINTIDSHANTFFIDENILGESVLLATGVKEFSVQYEYFSDTDYDVIVNDANLYHEQFFGIEDIENETALRANNPTDNDFFWVLRLIQSRKGLFSSQQYGTSTALINSNGVTDEIVVFDVPFEGTDTLTRSTTDTISGITDNSWIFGSGTAPYLPVEFTNTKGTEDTSDDELDNYWLRDFQTRAFYSLDKGQTIVPVVPPESTYGGISVITDMSEGGVAVGYASTSIAPRATSLISSALEKCNESTSLATIPEVVCIDNALRPAGAQLYSIQPVKWEIDGSGDIVSEEILDHLITPHPDDERGYGITTIAQASNDKGTVVGYADGWLKSNVTNPKKDEKLGSSYSYSYAVVFKDDRVVELNPDHSDHFISRANDINNNDIVVGQLNNGARNEFYYIDVTDIDNMEMVFPTGFFNGSASIANSINDEGFVVGNGDVKNHLGQLRKHGFLYNINTDTFTDLNDYLPCDSKYTIADASSINENNEVLATAIVEVTAQDSDGVDILDSNGDPYLDEISVAVKLNPTDGEIETCSTDDDEDLKVERQGAGFGFGLLLVLSVLGFRRKI